MLDRFYINIINTNKKLESSQTSVGGRLKNTMMLPFRLMCLKKKKKDMKLYQARKRNPPNSSLLLYLKWLTHSVNLIIS